MSCSRRCLLLYTQVDSWDCLFFYWVRKQLTLPDRQPAKRKACSITEDQALAKRLADEGTGAARKQAKTTNSCQTNAGNKTVGL